jgi:hypothetical protein
MGRRLLGDRTIEFELSFEHRSMLWKSPQIIVNTGLVAAVCAKAELTVNQIQRRFHVLGNRGIHLQVLLGQDWFAVLPALSLIDV